MGTFNNLLQGSKNWEPFPPFHNVHLDKNQYFFVNGGHFITRHKINQTFWSLRLQLVEPQKLAHEKQHNVIHS
jgi:hypothetical protein